MSAPTSPRVTADEARKITDLTDWDRLRREEAAGIEPEPDKDDFELDWSRAELVLPEPKTPVSIRLDPEVVAFFKAQGKGYQTRINAVLRAYMKARQARQTP